MVLHKTSSSLNESGFHVVVEMPINDSDYSTISIALATYNGSRFLQDQLDSLASQTILPCELVVTDDGSTDSTLDIISRFGETAPFPVRIHKNEGRLGYADNFLRAASLCTGDLIAFCDQDDVWLPSKLETCARAFRDHEDVSLVIHAGETWDGTNLLGKRFPAIETTRVHTPGTLNPFALTPGFAMVFRRDLLELTDNADRPRCMFGIGAPMSHDCWIWLLSSSTSRVIELQDALVHYRQHPTNTVGAPKKKGLVRKIKTSISTVDYAGLSRNVATAARILSDLSSRASVASASHAFEVGCRLKAYSEMLAHRTSLYSAKSNIFQRVKSFTAIALMGGYRPDSCRMRLGREAVVKDFLVGVPGLFKLIS